MTTFCISVISIEILGRTRSFFSLSFPRFPKLEVLGLLYCRKSALKPPQAVSPPHFSHPPAELEVHACLKWHQPGISLCPMGVQPPPTNTSTPSSGMIVPTTPWIKNIETMCFVKMMERPTGKWKSIRPCYLRTERNQSPSLFTAWRLELTADITWHHVSPVRICLVFYVLLVQKRIRMSR